MEANLNYPLIKSDWEHLTQKDLLSYLSYFPLHKMSMEVKEETKKLISYHMYKDGLSLRVTWDLNLTKYNEQSFTVQKILGIVNDNFQRLVYMESKVVDIISNPIVNIITYSKEQDYSITDEVIKRFTLLLKMNKVEHIVEKEEMKKIPIDQMNQELHYRLEYDVTYSSQEEKLRIPDSSFQELHTLINNFSAFEKYLEQHSETK